MASERQAHNKNLSSISNVGESDFFLVESAVISQFELRFYRFELSLDVNTTVNDDDLRATFICLAYHLQPDEQIALHPIFKRRFGTIMHL
jgi:hypothetical protein